MRTFLARLLINSAGLWAATEWVTGVSIDPGLGTLIFVAFIFGLINALIKPIVQFLSFPLIFLTLGLFTLVINTLMFMLTDWMLDAFHVTGFEAAFWGALVVSLVSWLLSMIFDEKKTKKNDD